MMDKLDDFTRAYIEAALWSSTLEPFGECAKCGKNAPLCQYAQFDEREKYPEEWSLCANCGNGGANDYEPPADANYSASDLAPDTLARMIADCERFQDENGETIYNAVCSRSGEYSDLERAGHDFWLTRNGHGCGFWDGDWDEPAATRLTEASKRFGECNLYVGDDGRIYA